MFSPIHEHRALLPVLCGLVFFALWNNLILWTFCPHLSARPRHCLTEESLSSSDTSASRATISHEHHRDMAMSEMDEEEVAREGATTAESKSSNLSITDIKALSRFEAIFSEAITDSQESCSHCMMHSQSGVNSPSTAMVLSNSPPHDIAAAASSVVWSPVASPLTFVDVHDHGPPGLNSSRYILNSSFRI
jgi:hypothetical protein